MTYGCTSWGNTAKRKIKKLQTVQNKVDVPWYVSNYRIHENLGMKTIYQFIKDYTVKFYEKTEDHENVLIKKLEKYTPKVNRPKYLTTRTDLKIYLNNMCMYELCEYNSGLIQQRTMNKVSKSHK